MHRLEPVTPSCSRTSNEVPRVAHATTTIGPDFICIGMGSAGSSWLWDQLRYHPDFWMPPIKEFGYLLSRGDGLSENKSKRYSAIQRHVEKGWKSSNRRPDDMRDIQFMEEAIAARSSPMDFDRYLSFFRFKEEALSGEVTPGYSKLSGNIIAQIADRLPNVKIILLVRDPLDRAWSRITKRTRKGLFEPKVIQDGDAFMELVKSRKMGNEWFPSRVWTDWKKHAPNVAFQHFFFDDISRAPENTRDAILRFINGDPSKPSGELVAGHNHKEQSEKVYPTESVKAAMIDYFREELLTCAQMFGGTAREWPKRYGL